MPMKIHIMPAKINHFRVTRHEQVKFSPKFGFSTENFQTTSGRQNKSILVTKALKEEYFSASPIRHSTCYTKNKRNKKFLDHMM